MNQSTHIDMALAAADFVGWKGDRKLLARSAAFPDTVRAVHVDGFGAHIIGRNCASFCHFNRRVVTPTGFVNKGYNWEQDRSIPKLDVIDKKVIPHPEEWGFPTDEMSQASEPLESLVRTLTNPKTKGTILADRITYPAACIEAQWCEDIVLDIPKNALLSTPEIKQQACDTVAGWALHFVEDCCVPHHAEGLLLKGHSSFEGDVEDEWRNMRGKDFDPMKLLEPEIEAAAEAQKVVSLRAICENNALQSQCAPCRLGYYRWVWRRGWRKLVNATILRGFRSSVQALRRIQALQR